MNEKPSTIVQPPSSNKFLSFKISPFFKFIFSGIIIGFITAIVGGLLARHLSSHTAGRNCLLAGFIIVLGTLACGVLWPVFRILRFMSMKIMGGIRESTAEETYEYNLEPAALAQVCQDALNKFGKVTEVSRQTGTISGKINTGYMSYAHILIRLARKGDITELSVQCRRPEGVFSSGGAQKALTMLMKELGEDKLLAGKSTGAW